MADATLTSKQSNAVLAGNAFVARFKREPVSPSDAAWLNGFVIALESNTSETVEQPTREEALRRIEEACRSIEILCDHFGMDPAEFLVDSRSEKANSCVCGEPNSPGTHRTDGPCLAPMGDRR